MKPDDLGFLYPEIDTAKCIKCNLCDTVCSFNPHYDISSNFDQPQAYAVRHKNISEIETSRSGAAFIAISDLILNAGGVVYGAAFEDHFKVVHKRASSRKERDEFKGSKYVQSELGNTFKEILSDLRNDKTVMFSGTPCQTSGLRSFLKKANAPTDNLYLIDIVCHGVPAPYIWRDYLLFTEKSQGQKATQVSFRDKSDHGWGAHYESFTFNNKKKYKDTYSYLFNAKIMFRHSCGKCYFANLARPSDITIADFWGWEKVDKSLNQDNKGISLVLVNSEKGAKLFAEVSKDINKLPVVPEQYLQPNLIAPTKINPSRDLFESEYKKYGFKHVAKKFGNTALLFKLRSLTQRIRRVLMRLLRHTFN